MHSVIDDICTGCELCIPPCPVDCIELLEALDTQVQNAKNLSADLYVIKEHINHKARVRIKHKNKKNIDLAERINQRLNNRNIDKEANLKLIQERLLNKS